MKRACLGSRLVVAALEMVAGIAIPRTPPSLEVAGDLTGDEAHVAEGLAP